jgi:ferritin-like metal-binding protein YciE
MTVESPRDLFRHELQDIYDAEQILVDALGELAESSTNEELKSAFEEHREETQRHVDRVEKVLDELGFEAKARPCAGVRGLVEERATFVKETPSKEILDVFQNEAGLKTERYEITAYEGLVQLAEQVGAGGKVVELLRQTLDEERAAFEKLQRIAKRRAAKATKKAA